LDKKNFIKVYKKFYPDGRPQAFCDHVFRVFDRDSDGHVGNIRQMNIKI